MPKSFPYEVYLRKNTIIRSKLIQIEGKCIENVYSAAFALYTRFHTLMRDEWLTKTDN